MLDAVVVVGHWATPFAQAYLAVQSWPRGTPTDAGASELLPGIAAGTTRVGIVCRGDRR